MVKQIFEPEDEGVPSEENEKFTEPVNSNVPKDADGEESAKVVIKGDNAKYINNYGTINIYSGKVAEGVGDEAVKLLDEKVREKIELGSQPKHLLLPVKAAKEADVQLPFNDVAGFNKRYGVSVSDSEYSRWVNGSSGYKYTESELSPLYNLFVACEGLRKI